MERIEIRLECLRLAHRHDRTSAQVIEVATELEDWVYLGLVDNGKQDNSGSETLSKKERRRLKSSGNTSSILS